MKHSHQDRISETRSSDEGERETITVEGVSNNNVVFDNHLMEEEKKTEAVLDPFSLRKFQNTSY